VFAAAFLLLPRAENQPLLLLLLLLFFFSSASVWFFSFWSLVGVELLVAFRRCGGVCWPVELLWGATVALLLSMQRREPLFSFFCLIDTPSSVAALWQRWRGRPTVVLLFLSFFLCDFLSPQLLSVFLCFPFLSASCLYRLPLSVSVFPPHCLVPSSVFLFFVVQYWCGCDGEWQWLLDEEDDELMMAFAVLVRLSPLLYSFLCRSPLVFPLLFFSSLFIVFLWLL